jgi:hypothetical protein
MKTAVYQGRRVQVIGETQTMTLYEGNAYPNDDKIIIIRELGENIIAGVDSTTGVEPDELSDYQDVEEYPASFAEDWYIRKQKYVRIK